MGMSIKVCSCTHRKERHCVENMSRVGCKECDCQQYKLDDEFIQPYSKIVTGAHRADLIVEHLRRCGIDKRIACLYAVHVPSSGMVRIGKTVDLVYRWVSRMAEWPGLYDVRLIAAIPGAQKHETEVHAYFSDLRIYSEWFHYDKDIEVLGECKVPSDVTALLLEPRHSKSA